MKQRRGAIRRIAASRHFGLFVGQTRAVSWSPTAQCVPRRTGHHGLVRLLSRGSWEDDCVIVVNEEVLSHFRNNLKGEQACRHGIRSGYRICLACW